MSIKTIVNMMVSFALFGIYLGYALHSMGVTLIHSIQIGTMSILAWLCAFHLCLALKHK